MNEFGFEEIFAELLDEDRSRQLFLEALAAMVPGSDLLLLGPGQLSLSLGKAIELGVDEAAQLGRQVSGGQVIARPWSEGWLYVLAVPQLEATLCWRLPGQRDLSGEPALLAFLRHGVAYALEEEKRREEAAQDEQYRHQIEVLKKQHGELIEDNYRQYRINQQQQEEYTRNLESEIARQTAELRQANARLEESSRLKSEFLANMSHELRTPMNAITGFAELLAETPLNQEQDEYCRTIRQAAAALLNLINDILDLAKIEAGKLDLETVPFSLDELLEGVRAMFTLAARKKGIEITIKRGEGLPDTLRGDSHRLRQVLINLLGNAIKFTEQGGVELEVAAGSTAADKVRLFFAVRDSGMGISPHRLEAIFEKFTQADGSTTRRFGGTGLGLAICRQLVELMGGQIEVSSQQGKGSTFSFEIELERESAAKKPPPAPATVPGPVAGDGVSRVLLVEDNPVNQRLASLLLAKQGCQVTVAGDGRQALEKLAVQEFELVFMDIQMPRLDGLEATRRLRELEADPAARAAHAALARRTTPLPVVGLTAHARKEDEEACYAAGMDGFLSKPIVKAKLLAVLQQFAGR